MTSIRFALARRSYVELRIYDAAGTLVRVLFSANLAPDWHTVTWDGTDARGMEVPSGIYLYQLESADFSATRKMVLLR